jgi:hypothetical protein
MRTAQKTLLPWTRIIACVCLVAGVLPLSACRPNTCGPDFDTCTAGNACVSINFSAVCAPTCSLDGGTGCASGQSCELVSSFCSGSTACSAVGVPVCVTATDHCPATAPANGAACPAGLRGSLTCEWGGDAHGECTTIGTCSLNPNGAESTWSISSPDATCAQQPAQCPASFASPGSGAACPATGITCEFPEGLCDCLPCAGADGGGSQWQCRPWTDVAPGCPVSRPLLGSVCPQEGLACDYGECCGVPLGPDMRCSMGEWTSAVNPACSCAEKVCQ